MEQSLGYARFTEKKNQLKIKKSYCLKKVLVIKLRPESL